MANQEDSPGNAKYRIGYKNDDQVIRILAVYDSTFSGFSMGTREQTNQMKSFKE